jgi:hypothetical protein
VVCVASFGRRTGSAKIPQYIGVKGFPSIMEKDGIACKEIRYRRRRGVKDVECDVVVE